jgi:CHC2-type zinc finger protein
LRVHVDDGVPECVADCLAGEARLLEMVREVFNEETAAWLQSEFQMTRETVVLPSGFPEPFFSDVRACARFNIVQLIAETVPTLTQAGTTWKGLCPFHEEKTPSFHVNPDKGFFHCFGCGAGGDAFKFIQNRDHVSFRDAVRFLAKRYLVELPEATENVTVGEAR